MMGFCEKCHSMEELRLEEKTKVQKIKGKEIEYLGKEAYCEKCGDEVFLSELRDYDLEIIEKTYRESEKLITTAQIKSILKIYDIGKRPLSLLLGWGELTLTRYINGDIPTKQYSEELNRIKENPHFLSKILEKNKENITRAAYNSCKKAIYELSESNLRGSDKIEEVTVYLLSKCLDITPLSLQKLLYYAQGIFKTFNGTYMFSDDCEAWIHGPVYRNVYEKYRDYGYNIIDKQIPECESTNLNENEKEVLDCVVKNFGCYSGKILERMTHVEKPWKNAREGISNNEASNRIIHKELISEYFNDIKQKYNMLNISDMKAYSIELFVNLN